MHANITVSFPGDPRYTYTTHRPPTVLDEQGVDTRKKRWLRARDLEKMGIFLFHYSLLFPLQVFNKISYYKECVPYSIDSWEESVYRRLENPFRVHNVYQHIGWLERFRGSHPAAVVVMMSDIQAGNIKVQIRDCADVERLLSSSTYNLAVSALRMRQYHGTSAILCHLQGLCIAQIQSIFTQMTWR